MRLSFPHPLYYYWYEVGMLKVAAVVVKHSDCSSNSNGCLARHVGRITPGKRPVAVVRLAYYRDEASLNGSCNVPRQGVFPQLIYEEGFPRAFSMGSGRFSKIGKYSLV